MYEVTLVFGGVHGKKKFRNMKQMASWGRTHVTGVRECRILSVRKDPKVWMPI